MKSFKVGDRVRIVCPVSEANGREATVIDIGSSGTWKFSPKDDGKTAYYLDVDGFGKFGFFGGRVAFPAHELEPIVNPDETAWNEFKRYLQPNPIILAKEPA